MKRGAIKRIGKLIERLQDELADVNEVATNAAECIEPRSSLPIDEYGVWIDDPITQFQANVMEALFRIDELSGDWDQAYGYWMKDARRIMRHARREVARRARARQAGVDRRARERCS